MALLKRALLREYVPPFTGCLHSRRKGGGRVVRWCRVNFQCLGALLLWIIVGQGPTALEVGTGGGCLDIFSLVCHFSFLSPTVWETARYRLRYCLKGPLSPIQPTNQIEKKGKQKSSVSPMKMYPSFKIP